MMSAEAPRTRRRIDKIPWPRSEQKLKSNRTPLAHVFDQPRIGLMPAAMSLHNSNVQRRLERRPRRLNGITQIFKPPYTRIAFSKYF